MFSEFREVFRNQIVVKFIYCIHIILQAIFLQYKLGINKRRIFCQPIQINNIIRVIEDNSKIAFLTTDNKNGVLVGTDYDVVCDRLIYAWQRWHRNLDGNKDVYIIIEGVKIMLQPGTKAPEFSLPDQNGDMHTLSEYIGKKVILYFYPKDNTPGCTKQACGFSGLYPQFMEKGAVVLGVSKDSVASHKKFEEKYNLGFTLLSDTELATIQAYDVWQEKKNYGKVSMGVVRTTYLIDENGIIVKAFGKVRAAENPMQMLEELE